MGAGVGSALGGAVGEAGPAGVAAGDGDAAGAAETSALGLGVSTAVEVEEFDFSERVA